MKRKKSDLILIIINDLIGNTRRLALRSITVLGLFVIICFTDHSLKSDLLNFLTNFATEKDVNYGFNAALKASLSFSFLLLVIESIIIKRDGDFVEKLIFYLSLAAATLILLQVPSSYIAVITLVVLIVDLIWDAVYNFICKKTLDKAFAQGKTSITIGNRTFEKKTLDICDIAISADNEKGDLDRIVCSGETYLGDDPPKKNIFRKKTDNDKPAEIREKKDLNP